MALLWARDSVMTFWKILIVVTYDCLMIVKGFLTRRFDDLSVFGFGFWIGLPMMKHSLFAGGCPLGTGGCALKARHRLGRVEARIIAGHTRRMGRWRG